MSDDALVRKVLAPAGLEPPDNLNLLNSSADDAHVAAVPTSKSATSRLFASTFANKPVTSTSKAARRSRHGEYSSSSSSPAVASSAAAVGPAYRGGGGAPGILRKPARRPGARGGRGARERFMSDDDIDEEAPGTAASSSSGGGSGGRGGGFPVGVAPGGDKPVPMAGLVEVDLEDASSGRPSGPVGGEGGRRNSGDAGGPIDGPSLLLDAAARGSQGAEREGWGGKSTHSDGDGDDGNDAAGVGSTVGTAGTEDADNKTGGLTGDEILSTLRTMEVTSDGESKAEAYAFSMGCREGVILPLCLGWRRVRVRIICFSWVLLLLWLWLWLWFGES